MRVTIPYLYELTPMDSVEIEDVGNICLQLFNDLGYYWVIEIRTQHGQTEIRTYGPLSDSYKGFTDLGFNFNCTRMEYNDTKIKNFIDKFLNDNKKGISQVFEISIDTAVDKLNNIGLMMWQGIK